jgi:divalent metal cation (Fe/Co/Zn/Cd) transporter
VLRACWSLGSASIDNLLDTAPAGLAAQLRETAEKVPGVLAVTQLRAKPAGPDLFLSVSVDIPRTLAVKEIVSIKERVESALRAHAPKADLTITTNPVALDNETAFDQVTLIAQHRGMAIHHLAVQDVAGKLAVSFDLEVDGGTSLLDAHAQATQLESEIRDALGGGVEVESHIEPLPQRMIKGQPVEGDRLAKIVSTLQALARGKALLQDLHNVRVRETDGALYLHYHCRFAAGTRVEMVHEVIDAFEDEIKNAIPGIARVIAHAEPIGAKRHPL